MPGKSQNGGSQRLRDQRLKDGSTASLPPSWIPSSSSRPDSAASAHVSVAQHRMTNAALDEAICILKLKVMGEGGIHKNITHTTSYTVKRY